jgi:hypothetical protein
LQIISVKNDTASLVIHPPWNATNAVYDLLYCTNLLPPIAWQWILRSQVGFTNLIVPNATAPRGFYALAAPSDVNANSSAGTNFWLTFNYMVGFEKPHFSLYISSLLASTGTVTIPLLGFTNAFALAPGTMTNIAISSAIIIPNFNAIGTNGIQIIASQPVSVHAFDFDTNAASMAFNVFPTSLLGTNYCVMSYPAYFTAQSLFAIVATADDTVVNIVPPRPPVFRASPTLSM